MSKKIRILYMEGVSPLRSQTVYHAVGYAMKESTPNTIIMASPNAPYVCVGYHQDIQKEVDLDYCTAHNLPVYRREVGGGAVYLDNGQLFTQWIFHNPSGGPDLGAAPRLRRQVPRRVGSAILLSGDAHGRVSRVNKEKHTMFLKHRDSNDLVEVTHLADLFDPCVSQVRGRFHSGEEMQDEESFAKAALAFPSGEALPACWRDPNYRR